MKTDKNTVIGFVLIGILFIGYFWFSNRQQQVILLEKKRTEDSIARVKQLTAPKNRYSDSQIRFIKKRFYN
jgi:YidC/Oxa1 family membrane protein insertase